MYRIDRNSNGEGIFSKSEKTYIPHCWILNYLFKVMKIINLFALKQTKRFLVCTYNPNKNLIWNHLKQIGKKLDNYSSKYHNFVLLGDPNSEPTESVVRDFCQIYGCKSLTKDNNCYKNPEKTLMYWFYNNKQTNTLSKFCGIRNRVVRFS